MLLNKKIVLLIACICVLLCFVNLQDTYAKYTSAVNETTDISIARWRILVNDYDIRSSASTTNLITPQFDGNSNIAADVIAPTATGYLEVVVDATGTDLAFNYTITVDNHEDSPVTDIIVTRATLNETDQSPGTNLNVSNGVITGTIGLSDQRSNRFLIYIEWNDGNNQTMDNADDTATTLLQNSVATLSVTANFTQVGNPTPTPVPTVTPEPTPAVNPDPEEP